jgi:hypothetical protein
VTSLYRHWRRHFSKKKKNGFVIYAKNKKSAHTFFRDWKKTKEEKKKAKVFYNQKIIVETRALEKRGSGKKKKRDAHRVPHFFSIHPIILFRDSRPFAIFCRASKDRQLL